MAFKPGQSGNPSGKPPMSKEEAELLFEVKSLRKIDKLRLDKAFHAVSSMSVDELTEFSVTKSVSSLEILAARIFMRSIGKGDMVSLNLILDRIIGPVTKHVNVTGNSFTDIMERALQKEKERKENEDSGRGDTEGA